jgi:hypothetical protein
MFLAILTSLQRQMVKRLITKCRLGNCVELNGQSRHLHAGTEAACVKVFGMPAKGDRINAHTTKAHTTIAHT